MSFESEKQAWNNEVEREAAALVRRGVPPFDAICRARDLVSRRREAEHAND